MESLIGALLGVGLAWLIIEPTGVGDRIYKGIRKMAFNAIQQPRGK